MNIYVKTNEEERVKGRREDAWPQVDDIQAILGSYNIDIV